MWDIIVPLVLMAIFYILPEILKKKRRQAEYKYPEIPDQVPPPVETRAPAPDRVPPPEQRRPEERPAPVRMPAPDVVRPPASDERPRPAAAAVFEQSEVHIAAVNMSAAAQVSSAMLEAGPWDGQLTQEAVVNGIVFAEVIQPPRCKRPMRHCFGRG
ncbi:MAG: hypothetical protein RIN56_10620 [Sporomusaceae bacterium]|nr:hypothetical protein [Sporomusaceae bacterium]